MGRVRAVSILTAFIIATPPLMVLQWLLLRAAPKAAVAFPNFYHRNLCRLLQARIEVKGEPVCGSPCLIAANHCSWLDITVLSAVCPLSFIAKQEVATWPLFGSLARLQRTLFVDRDRRSATGRFKAEIEERLRAGDTLVLFPEGTSTDGNRVLPFKSALMGAADLTYVDARTGEEAPVPVQPVTLAYTRIHGLPLGRYQRNALTWFGDMDLAPHLWQTLRRGPFDVVIEFHEPLTIADTGNRKALARHCETVVRAGLTAALRGRAAKPAANS